MQFYFMCALVCASQLYASEESQQHHPNGNRYQMIPDGHPQSTVTIYSSENNNKNIPVEPCAPSAPERQTMNVLHSIDAKLTIIANKLNNSCEDRCNRAGSRADAWCNRWINQSDCGECVMGLTICLPCTVVSALCCGTTYVCCNSQCSKRWLEIHD